VKHADLRGIPRKVEVSGAGMKEHVILDLRERAARDGSLKQVIEHY
jgi:hypothetical protein